MHFESQEEEETMVILDKMFHPGMLSESDYIDLMKIRAQSSHYRDHYTEGPYLAGHYMGSRVNVPNSMANDIISLYKGKYHASSHVPADKKKLAHDIVRLLRLQRQFPSQESYKESTYPDVKLNSMEESIKELQNAFSELKDDCLRIGQTLQNAFSRK